MPSLGNPLSDMGGHYWGNRAGGDMPGGWNPQGQWGTLGCWGTTGTNGPHHSVPQPSHGFGLGSPGHPCPAQGFPWIPRARLRSQGSQVLPRVLLRAPHSSPGFPALPSALWGSSGLPSCLRIFAPSLSSRSCRGLPSAPWASPVCPRTRSSSPGPCGLPQGSPRLPSPLWACFAPQGSPWILRPPQALPRLHRLPTAPLSTPGLLSPASGSLWLPSSAQGSPAVPGL